MGFSGSLSNGVGFLSGMLVYEAYEQTQDLGDAFFLGFILCIASSGIAIALSIVDRKTS